MTLPPSNVPERPLERRDEQVPPARGTRSTGYDDGAPPGAPAAVTTAPAAPPKAPAAPAKAVPAPAAAKPQPGKLISPPAPGATVPKAAPKIPKPPVPTPFPPPELAAECEAWIARYPDRVAALIPILHLAQRKMGGWISPELEAGIAKYLGVSDQHVRGVVTFYTMFNTKPVGRHHVQVCRTLSCWLRGAAGLTRRIEEKTGLKPGETGNDLRYTVSEVECVGLCEVAPALFVNDTPHVSMTTEGLDKLLDGLK